MRGDARKAPAPIYDRRVNSRDRISSGATRFLAPLIAALGLVIIARTIAAGGGPFSAGVVLGTIFVAIGIARLYLLMRTRN